MVGGVVPVGLRLGRVASGEEERIPGVTPIPVVKVLEGEEELPGIEEVEPHFST